jgi:RNA-binding protein
MGRLRGFERAYLRGLGQGLKPVVHVGRSGAGESLVRAADRALDSHELIKVKFVDLKEKDEKRDAARLLEEALSCELVGMIGHTGLFYRPHPEPEKRRVRLPERPGAAGDAGEGEGGGR